MAKGFNFDEEARRLYALPLDEFVAERDAAAKELREAGEAEAAREVKALRKPNLPAWGVNRAVAADPKAADGLIEAGEKLERAQRKAVEGKGADALRKAMAGYADAVEELMRSVEAELGGAGGTTAVDRARETLRAVAGDEELRDELRGGRLVRDREAAGLGGGGTPAPASKRAPPARSSAPKQQSASSRKRAEQKLHRAERAMEAAASRRKDAERRLERAHRGVADAEEELADAKRALAAREDELGDARAAMPG
jgi:hypothetical protein